MSLTIFTMMTLSRSSVDSSCLAKYRSALFGHKLPATVSYNASNASLATVATNTAYNSIFLPLRRTPLMPRCFRGTSFRKDRPEAKVLIDIVFALDLPYSTKATVEAL